MLSDNAALLDCYWQGCQQPLTLFPETSLTYAKITLNNSSRSIPQEAALKRWIGDPYRLGEADDRYYQQLYQDLPLDDTFRELALKIFQPISDHLVSGKL